MNQKHAKPTNKLDGNFMTLSGPDRREFHRFEETTRTYLLKEIASAARDLDLGPIPLNPARVHIDVMIVHVRLGSSIKDTVLKSTTNTNDLNSGFR